MGLIEVRNTRDLPEIKWSGGVTKELLRVEFLNSDTPKDYELRVSTAIIEAGESNFSDFTGYNRALVILEGDVELSHSMREYFSLNRDMVHYFNGGIVTKSRCSDTVIDFNVIELKKSNYIRSDVKITSDTSTEKNSLSEYKNLIYNPYREQEIWVDSINLSKKEKISLKKGDFIILEEGTSVVTQGKLIIVKIFKK